jgi:hypothetical protein
MITDDVIESIVLLVEEAEKLSTTLHAKTSVTVRMMLKSWQVIGKIQESKAAAFIENFSSTKKPQ